MTNSEYLEEMMFHIHESYLINDFKKQIQKVEKEKPNLEYHDKVFVIFQTLEARDKVENTGIGLAIVKKIVESQGGTMRLESQEGQGATFYFTWRKQPTK